MRRWLIVGGLAVAGVSLLARVRGGCASARSGFDFGKMIERMPENAPPRWMFRNITAIRENTERILELLEREHVLEPVSEAAAPLPDVE